MIGCAAVVGYLSNEGQSLFQWRICSITTTPGSKHLARRGAPDPVPLWLPEEEPRPPLHKVPPSQAQKLSASSRLQIHERIPLYCRADLRSAGLSLQRGRGERGRVRGGGGLCQLQARCHPAVQVHRYYRRYRYWIPYLVQHRSLFGLTASASCKRNEIASTASTGTWQCKGLFDIHSTAMIGSKNGSWLYAQLQHRLAPSKQHPVSPTRSANSRGAQSAVSIVAQRVAQALDLI